MVLAFSSPPHGEYLDNLLTINKQFHLKRFFLAYISELKKVYFMSRSFAKPAFSRTVTIDIKQLTSSTQNTFTFQNYLSYFGRWLEKFTELRSNWRSAPPPTAPPSSLSSTCWLDPFSSNVKKGKDTSMLGNVDEEDVEKDDQGWLLDGQPTKNCIIGRKGHP